LIVDLAIDVVGVGKVDELGAGLKVAVVPALEAHTGGSATARILHFGKVEKHELSREEVEALILEGRIHGTAEGHQLGFDASEVRESAHGEEHFLE